MGYRRQQQGIPGLYGGDARGLYGSRGYGRGSMIYGRPRTPLWPKLVLAILILLILGLCVKQFACGGIFPKQEEPQQQEQEQQEEEEVTPESTTKSTATGTITISAVGDCTLGTDEDLPEDTNFTVIYKANGSEYFFKRVTKFTESDDITIANLEGAITDGGEFEDKGENSYNFKGPSSYTKILTKGGVDFVNLANNHSFDYGSDGYNDTKANLEKAGIGFACGDLTYTKEVNGIKVGFLGINATAGYDYAKETMEESMAALKAENCDLIIGVFHWGTEGQYDVEEEQTQLGHAAIDEGCDLVLGGHPHLLQGVEKYNDRYIVYSLGNFVFGGNDDPMDYETMIYQQSFTFDNGELVMDNTVSSARIIPCRVSSVTSINNYEPLPLGGNEGKAVVKHVNSRSEKLSGGVKFSTKLDDDDIAKVKTSK